jgi:hypothetical protein
METLKNLLNNLANKLDQLLGNSQLQEIPVRARNQSSERPQYLKVENIKRGSLKQ